MTVTTKGFKELRGKILNASKIAEAKFDTVNKQNADELAALARVLIPQSTGLARTLINVLPWPDGGYAVDFGPISKILEGGTVKRATKIGANRGKGPAIPFVNPALNGTRSKRKARNRKAVRDAWREADG